jgi:hypothetical protein
MFYFDDLFIMFKDFDSILWIIKAYFKRYFILQETYPFHKDFAYNFL